MVEGSWGQRTWVQHVELSGLDGVIDAGVLPLLESFEAGLVKVNLSGCTNVTNKVVSSLANLHGWTLENLNLDGCRNISDASLMAIAENCALLCDLDVSKCSIIDAGIAALAHAQQINLQILSLSGYALVSDRSLPALRKLGRTLLGLNIQHCNAINSWVLLRHLLPTTFECIFYHQISILRNSKNSTGISNRIFSIGNPHHCLLFQAVIPNPQIFPSTFFARRKEAQLKCGV
ncbi:hypothetical protein VIGAN_06094600 [Vigna angularis var. angularis]|uniref:F-box/LRR-repeat protein 15-like leucin rich repeat domain-containing protein n=1 Tax=Vigna angularis var. angularis TaxID=157739 RepID=A0A0S3SAF9_PHAAN|nr:hypothetical protein VIGAN_06094600 [Vigna angularis var. angularis]